jgi:hypothetical protein
VPDAPYQAVKLGMPSTPRWAESGAIAGSILRRPLPSWSVWVAQFSMPITVSPLAKRGFFDSTTSPTDPPVSGLSSSKGGV